MEYTSLFNHKTRLSLGNNLCCLSGRVTDAMDMIRKNPFPILFVLHGELKMQFKTRSEEINQGHFAVIASANLVDYSPFPSSVVMVFYPSERFAGYLGMSSKTFKMSISEILPIRTPLQEWLDGQLERYAADGNSVEHINAETDEQKRCSELVRILIAYPRDMINTLYIPLYVCSIHDCKNCRLLV